MIWDELEDARGVLRIAAANKPDLWTTYRITDAAWAFAEG